MKRKKINDSTKFILWAKSAGRCEMTGCNRILYESHITHDSLNNAQIAHNCPSSDGGPRGEKYLYINKEFNRDDIENLLLLCPSCHKEIDSNPDKYTVTVLKEMKKIHEERIRTLTSITEERECLTIIYSSSIADDYSGENNAEMLKALGNLGYYSSNENTITIGFSTCGFTDGIATNEKALSLRKSYREIAGHRINEKHKPVAIFALAPIPLLIYLGTLFPTGTTIFPFLKLRASRENGCSWRYILGDENSNNPFIVESPKHPDPNRIIVLVLETTDYISKERILSAFNQTDIEVDIWRIQHKSPGYDLDSSEIVLNYWKKTILNTTNSIRRIYGQKIVNIFPAINNAFAVMLGFARVRKTDTTWAIYDNVRGVFNKQLEIGEETNEF